MIKIHMSVAVGTAAALLATILLSLRITLRGRRPALILAQRWTTTRPPASTVILVLLSTIAALSFLGSSDGRPESPPTAGDFHSTATVTPGGEDAADTGDALTALRTYAGNLEDNRQSTTPVSNTQSAALPDVDTMIAQLVARLEKQPDDVKGWKMLGWSYLNMDRPEDAARAYETALKLQPGDVEIQKALEQAKSAKSPTSR